MDTTPETALIQAETAKRKSTEALNLAVETAYQQINDRGPRYSLYYQISYSQEQAAKWGGDAARNAASAKSATSSDEALVWADAHAAAAAAAGSWRTAGKVWFVLAEALGELTAEHERMFIQVFASLDG